MAGLPWPISQQRQDSHLENIWVSFQSIFVGLQWNRASPRRKDDDGVGLLNYEDRPGLETGGFGWSPMSSRSLSWPQDLNDNNDDHTHYIYQPGNYPRQDVLSRNWPSLSCPEDPSGNNNGGSEKTAALAQSQRIHIIWPMVLLFGILMTVEDSLYI